MSNPSTTQPWHAAYPEPCAAGAPVSRETVLQWLRDGTAGPGGSIVLVDVRRNDFEGGTIRGALNLPAQSLYPTLPTLYAVLAGGGVRKVVWYCGSSRGRGTRTAGWFKDYIAGQEGTMESLVLTGGIKGWVAAGEEYTEWMQEFEKGVWESTS